MTMKFELSQREVEVIMLVREGMTNKEIGDRVGLSPLTIKAHLARISRKLGARSRAHIVSLVIPRMLDVVNVQNEPDMVAV